MDKRFLQAFLNYLNGVWEKSRDFSRLTFFEKLFFIVLSFVFEPCYSLAFLFYKFFRINFFRSKEFPFKVISVGNVSCGGVGKSVVTKFLAENLKGKGAVILRGYRGRNEKTRNSFLVSDGKEIFCDATFAGDEASMFARSLSVPVVVGKDKAKSCNLISNGGVSRVDYVLLDDGYQNYSVKKDLEVLLLDARRPLENGHCLPAGRLREKDLSRADLIILTRGDMVQKSRLEILKKEISKKEPFKKVFVGRHSGSVFRGWDFKKIDKGKLEGKKFVIFAGIGSFDGFVETVCNAGIDVVCKIEYRDHHSYSFDDIKNIIISCKKNSAFGVLTTQKDWQKVEPLISLLAQEDRCLFHCQEVCFEFLLQQDHDYFFKLIKERLDINQKKCF